MGFPGLGGGSGLECCHSPSQQPSHSSLIIPEESKHYPWCTGASGTGPPLAPYRVGWTHFHNSDGLGIDIFLYMVIIRRLHAVEE